IFLSASFLPSPVQAQWQAPEQQLDPIVQQIVQEAYSNSQLKQLAHELLDVVGPRLVGTPQMKHAHDWAVAKYKDWGIEARYEEFGEWRRWVCWYHHIYKQYHPGKT